MAYRVVKTHPKRGTVSRQKVKAAAKAVAKRYPAKAAKPQKFTRADTASGQKKIAFRKPTFRVA
jgi:hypothetical protein